MISVPHGSLSQNGVSERNAPSFRLNLSKQNLWKFVTFVRTQSWLLGQSSSFVIIEFTNLNLDLARETKTADENVRYVPVQLLLADMDVP